MSSTGFRLISALLVIVMAANPVARADETDQFTLPLEPEFADLGDYFSLVHYRVLDRVVTRTNKDIRRALNHRNEARRASTLARLHSPGLIADRVRHEWGPGFFEMRTVEDILHSSKMRKTFPDQLTGYRTPFWIYFYTHLPIDPRKLVLLFQASTVRAYDVYFGTDKLGHFHDLGHFYFKSFLRHRSSGLSDDEAIDRVVHAYSTGLISERALIGFWATGVYSNADLASNYAGFKFYKNLTEPTRVRGELQPPMLIRIGEFWALNEHVRPDNQILKPFITDHWNEALNPSLYEWGMRGPIANRLAELADDILAFYADEDGQPRPREYFEELKHELSTYFGEPYGHSGIDDRLVTIANTCFPDDDEIETDSDEAEAEASKTSSLTRR